MKIKWVLQDNAFNEIDRLHKLTYILQEEGCEVKICKYIPFGGTDYNFWGDNSPSILHGSIEFLRNSTKDHIVWMDEEILKCSYYYTKIGKFLLQEYYGFYPLGELKRLEEVLFTLFSEPGDTPMMGRLLFIRPDDNDKSFVGGVVSRKMFLPWLEEVTSCNSATKMVIVAPFKQMKLEWRVIMDGSEPIAASLYRQKDNFVTEEGCPVCVKNFAKEVGEVWAPHPVWVLDIGQEYNDRLSVVELGGVNCAGWYKADPYPIIRAINKHARTFYQTRKSQ